MSKIEVSDHHVVYQNPQPQNRARHAYFPGLVKVPSGNLLALFMLGEALEATNNTTMVSRSLDQGRTWHLEGPLHERPDQHRHYSDSLKPTLLNDGTLIATGYRFHRTDPDETIVNPDTGGLREGDNLVSFSRDEGKTWTRPREVARGWPELIEQSGPSIQLRRGTILVSGSLFPMWDGTSPSGCVGILSRSDDRGETWNDQTQFFSDPQRTFVPAEPRLCELQDDRVVSLVWMLDYVNHRQSPNHVTVSHDAGMTWSKPIDTGVPAQASNLIHLEGDLLLSIHSHREGEDVGLYVRLVDFAGDTWRTVDEQKIWGNAPSRKVSAYAKMGENLKFGQPSLLSLGDGEYLATHWAIEECQSRIVTHRLRVDW